MMKLEMGPLRAAMSVLTDDSGAGKTIMAGLLLKELRLRSAVDRTLILAPARSSSQP